MANNAEHRNPKLLDALIKKYNVDVMTVTPSLMKINYDNREPDTALARVKTWFLVASLCQKNLFKT